MEERQDLISRRVAVDVVDFECGEWRGLAKTIIKKLEALPAVQPDHNADVSKKVTDEDCISRRVAIELCDWYDNPSLHDDLEKLPSVQPELDCALKEFGDCSYSETGCSDCKIKK